MPEPIADGLAQLAAGAAGEDLELAVRVGLLGRFVGADQRFVHAHGGRSAASAVDGAGSIPRPNGLPLPRCAPPVLSRSLLARYASILTFGRHRRQFPRSNWASVVARSSAHAMPGPGRVVSDVEPSFTMRRWVDADSPRVERRVESNGPDHHERPWHDSSSFFRSNPSVAGHPGSPECPRFRGPLDRTTSRAVPVVIASPDRRPSVKLASFAQAEGPSLAGGVGWINSGPISLAELRGKIVLLDFWTFCCINCHHVLPDLAQAGGEVQERASGHRRAHGQVRRRAGHREHPPQGRRVSDQAPGDQRRPAGDLEPLRRPELADARPASIPTASTSGSLSGEGHYEQLDRVIGKLVAMHQEKGDLNLTPLKFTPEMERPTDGPLLYPGKVFADAEGKRLFISDTGHNRIVQAGLDGSNALAIGDGAGRVRGRPVREGAVQPAAGHLPRRRHALRRRHGEPCDPGRGSEGPPGHDGGRHRSSDDADRPRYPSRGPPGRPHSPAPGT